ncbi:MAG: hypothetical protein P3B98_12915 [Gemmatimonadota bacterium]|nr:hypothetical protein [Gemmatimonadota bacterium]
MADVGWPKAEFAISHQPSAFCHRFGGKAVSAVEDPHCRGRSA